MKIKIELTSGEIKEYEIDGNSKLPYLELLQKLKEDGIKPEELKKIL